MCSEILFPLFSLHNSSRLSICSVFTFSLNIMFARKTLGFWMFLPPVFASPSLSVCCMFAFCVLISCSSIHKLSPHSLCRGQCHNSLFVFPCFDFSFEHSQAVAAALPEILLRWLVSIIVSFGTLQPRFHLGLVCAWSHLVSYVMLRVCHNACSCSRVHKLVSHVLSRSPFAFHFSIIGLVCHSVLYSCRHSSSRRTA